MKKYNELIQFEPVTTTIELEDSADHNKAEKLISSYVISEKMKSKLSMDKTALSISTLLEKLEHQNNANI